MQITGKRDHIQTEFRQTTIYAFSMPRIIELPAQKSKEHLFENAGKSSRTTNSSLVCLSQWRLIRPPCNLKAPTVDIIPIMSQMHSA
jgi:hypothetical protein